MTLQKDVVSIDEIKKDRDDRIKNLRSELDTTSKNFDDLSKSNASLEV
jgi:hypothetical protein